ncbi:TrgA family protein [Sedimentitalea sp. HM32M-2]|uniref:TrgA family protein n=1 Tax=Sedimentitalea sp. HM32M-2 TaxID=3351566 RepID=UPI00363E86C5
MPNAARLVAAITLALLAFILSGLIMPLMPEGTGFGYFTHINMLLGVVVGWIVVGKRAGRGWTAAVNNGLTGIVALVFWGLFVQGAYEMMRQAMRNRFDGPFEAVLAIFEIGAKYALTLLAPSLIAAALIGGVLSGLATEYAWRRWR